MPVNFEFILGLIGAVGFYVIWKEQTLKVDKRLLVWLLILFFYWFTNLIAAIYHQPLGGRGESVLNVVHSVFLFAVLLIALFLRKPPIDFFWFLMGVASLSVIFLMALEIYAQGWITVENAIRLGNTYSHPVKIGVFANTFFIILLGSIPWAYKRGKLFLSVWVVIILLDFACVILSQTRTAWIGWPEAMIGWGFYYYYLYKKQHPITNKVRVFIVLLPVLFIWGLLSIQPVKMVFEKRIAAAYSDVELYMSGKTFQSSLGHRLLSYEAAIEGIKSSPWIGIGEDAFPVFQRQMTAKIAEEKFHKKIKGLHYTHIHNQFLMAWLTKGVFVFLSVLGMFVFLIWYFVNGLKQASSIHKPIWVAGLVFSVASFLSFLPETPLQKSDTSTHFLLLTTLLLAFSVLTGRKKPVTIINNSE
ncbi:MAG: O-antigen ligase family protein [Thiomicrorhabdus chilensis]|uniref:O-antigen ligase family protein n=1 Tax=Thiomicrorhabdus chilensis TaxID=63656 RepID=UPI00299D1713|nr:O-antigen ligase family protein [Thiomicrorhabdus chilensis]MDX1347271.1 O-antigen ligase family protein [Thiomicrorhabdus chilensis]